MAVRCCHRAASHCRHLSIPLPVVRVKLPRVCCSTLRASLEALTSLVLIIVHTPVGRRVSSTALQGTCHEGYQALLVTAKQPC